MRIAIVLNFPPIDHRMVQARGIAKALAERGHELTLILQKGPGISQEEKDRRFEVVGLGGQTYSMLGQLVFMFQLLMYLRRSDFDVVHGRNPFSSILPALFLKKLRLTRASLVYDVRGLWIDFAHLSGKIGSFSRQLLLGLERIALNSVDQIIAISYELERILIERGVAPGRIVVVYGDGVDLDKFESVRPKEPRPGPKRIGYVGSVSIHKRVDELLRAFDQARPNLQSGSELVLIGPLGDDAGAIESLIARRGLQDFVHMKGQLPHDEALRHMMDFDVALSFDSDLAPSFIVAVHTKIFEYLAAGVPVIATRHPTHEVLLVDRYNSLLVEASSKAFADAIQEVMNDSSLAGKLSRNGIQSATPHDMRIKALEIEAVYTQSRSKT